MGVSDEEARLVMRSREGRSQRAFGRTLGFTVSETGKSLQRFEERGDKISL